jgi:hypothetical protein
MGRCGPVIALRNWSYQFGGWFQKVLGLSSMRCADIGLRQEFGRRGKIIGNTTLPCREF